MAELERLRGSTVVVSCTHFAYPKAIAEKDLSVARAVLRELERPPRLDFVFHSEGGRVFAARELATALRGASPHLGVFVPNRARSAGTLLCLAANELVLGPAAEFSPIDPLVRADDRVSPGGAPRISSEDIRNFRLMAESWFDLRSEESRLQVLKLLTSRFHPATLGAFFRANRYVRNIAAEFLAFQLPDKTPSEREQIAEGLVGGWSSHQDAILRPEILKLGLNARPTTEEEAGLVEAIYAECQHYMAHSPADPASSGRIRAVFFSAGIGFQYVASPAAPAADAGADATTGFGPPATPRAHGRWMRIPALSFGAQ